MKVQARRLRMIMRAAVIVSRNSMIIPHSLRVGMEVGMSYPAPRAGEYNPPEIITPATIYVKTVIPAKAGILNWPGCRIKPGMTFGMFNYRSNKTKKRNS